MADDAHLSALLKGATEWNSLREATDPDTWLNLSGADLSGGDLRFVHFGRTDLSRANLRGARLRGLQETDLRGANLDGADLDTASLDWADFRGASLRGARLGHAWDNHTDFRGANLQRASLVHSYFAHTDLRDTDLAGADLDNAVLTDLSLTRARLTGARLIGTILRRADIAGADFDGALIRDTAVIDVDLTGAIGLDKCRHYGPASIDQRSLAKSRNLPVAFLKGCGLSDWEIETAKLYRPGLMPKDFATTQRRIFDLYRANPGQRHNVFISYSHRDSEFVDLLEARLDAAGVRFWRDKHDAVAGRLDKNVERGMRSNPCVILVLSDDSIKSDWVEHEVSFATTLSKELSRDVLCPIALDDAWKASKWSGQLRTQIDKYVVLDFSRWKNGTQLDVMFDRLLGGLDLFYEA
jgi:uncharacterized protein YjbI with pentapeptide repeats